MDPKPEELNPEDKDITPTSEDLNLGNQNVNPAPETDASTTPSAAPEKKKIKKADKIIIAVLSILLLAGIGCSVFFLCNPTIFSNNKNELSHEDEKTEQDNKTSQIDKKDGDGSKQYYQVPENGKDFICTLTGDEVLDEQIKAVCNVITDAYGYLVSNNPEVDGISYYYDANGPLYQLDYLDFATAVTPVHYSYEISHTGNSMVAVDNFASFLIDNDFSYTGIDSGTFDDDESIRTYKNDQSGVICSVYDNEYSLPHRLICSHEAWYIAEDSQEAELHNGIAKAVKNAVTAGMIKNMPTSLDIHLDYGTLGIKDSEYEPYQSARVSLLNGWAKFYRVSPDADWVYFKGGNGSDLYCSEYNTEDIKKAFAGDMCFDDDSGEMITITY